MDAAFRVGDNVPTVSPRLLFGVGQYWFMFGRVWMDAGRADRHHGLRQTLAPKGVWQDNTACEKLHV